MGPLGYLLVPLRAERFLLLSAKPCGMRMMMGR
jgi:hypothetical protein